MKKYILSILIFIMFMPLIVKAETCDIDKISINSITIKDKSEQANEIEEATATGKKINLNLSMSNVGDNIEYKIVVKNASNDDYELDKKSFDINSDYIDYEFSSEDNSNIVKANSTKTLYLKINYKKEVPEGSFISGEYNDAKTMSFNLANDKDNDILKNPKTGVHYLLMIIILLSLSLITFLVLRKKKYIKILVIIIVSAFIIPISVYAICKCEIKIESNIKIEYLNSYFRLCMGSSFGQSDVYIPYRKGMTWIEFDDYILENYQKYKTYIQKSDGTLEEYGYLKKYGMDKDRIVLRNPGEFEFSEHVLPVTDTDNRDILYDNFFSFGKHKQPYSFTPVDYSYPNEYWAIENFETLYPEEYSQMATTDRWWIYNENIFEAKYGCYYFNGG